MPKNRLKLDWKITDAQGRADFVQDYVKTLDFEPNEEELEVLGNYLLFGKDEDGKNGVQKGDYQIETRFKAWTPYEPLSLEELQESPGFNEGYLQPIAADTVVPKITRQVFDREEALAKTEGQLRDDFLALFSQIDETEYLIGIYELEIGKRNKPIRAELINRLGADACARLADKAKTLNRRAYLFKKHELVELRSQQYVLAESYMENSINSRDCRWYTSAPIQRFDSDIPVYPLGFKYAGRNLVFKDENELRAELYTEEQLKEVSNLVNKEKKYKGFYFDFENADHVYELLMNLEDIYYGLNDQDVESNEKQLVDTIDYYIGFSDLTDLQIDILRMKIEKKKNQEIVEFVNQKYDTNYTANYISTIFRQKIIRQIVDSVSYHRRIVENLFFPENFKKCNCCGRSYLVDGRNFVKKTRARDGFSNTCKRCNRDDRERRKKD